MARKKRSYTSAPSTCPHPADHAGLAWFIHAAVKATHSKRLASSRNGNNAAARAAAKNCGHGRKRKPSGKKGG